MSRFRSRLGRFARHERGARCEVRGARGEVGRAGGGSVGRVEQATRFGDDGTGLLIDLVECELDNPLARLDKPSLSASILRPVRAGRMVTMPAEFHDQLRFVEVAIDSGEPTCGIQRHLGAGRRQPRRDDQIHVATLEH
jgi:hypothetical protein